MAEKMRVMGVTKEGVELAEITKPEPKRGEVRVRVLYSVVNPGEEKVIDGSIVGRFLHAKTSPLVLGWDFSGSYGKIRKFTGGVNMSIPWLFSERFYVFEGFAKDSCRAVDVVRDSRLLFWEDGFVNVFDCQAQVD